MIHRFLVDWWLFQQAWEDEELPLAPKSDSGTIYTRREWEEVRERVDLFFEMVEDTTIDEFNERKRDANRREWEERNGGTKKPVSKGKRQRPGYIYLMRSDAGHFKIGKSNNPHARQKNLGIKLPFQVHLVYHAKVQDMNSAEAALHEILEEARTNGEWFDLAPQDVEWITSGMWLDDLELREMCEEEVKA